VVIPDSRHSRGNSFHTTNGVQRCFDVHKCTSLVYRRHNCYHLLPAVNQERIRSIEWPDFHYASQYAIASITTRTKRVCSVVHREEVGRGQYDAGTLLFETDQLLRRHPELDLGQCIALPPAVLCRKGNHGCPVSWHYRWVAALGAKPPPC
jgi:hypothetical protein